VNESIIQRQHAAATAAGFDAIVSISPENFAYTAGFVVPSHPLMRWRHAAAIVTSDGDLATMVVDMEESTARSQLGQLEPAVWREFSDDPMAVLASELSRIGLSHGTIAIEFRYLPAGDFARLTALLPSARFVDSSEVLSRLRMVKTSDEIELLRRLSRISDVAIASAFDSAGPGTSEFEIASVLTRSVYTQGADQFKLMIVATGERSELPNVGPTDRRLEAGDVCRVEIFSVIRGYHAGVCRTAVVGDPSPEIAAKWDGLVECKELLLDVIKPGAIARDVYRDFREQFDRLGLPAISFVGHGIGLDLHEDPYLSATDNTVIEEGMVLGIEPLTYGTGLGYGLQLKDMIAVSGTGSELLSDRTNNDRLLLVG
jgi:Xaa-Pro dipeptidase